MLRYAHSVSQLWCGYKGYNCLIRKIVFGFCIEPFWMCCFLVQLWCWISGIEVSCILASSECCHLCVTSGFLISYRRQTGQAWRILMAWRIHIYGNSLLCMYVFTCWQLRHPFVIFFYLNELFYRIEGCIDVVLKPRLLVNKLCASDVNII